MGLFRISTMPFKARRIPPFLKQMLRLMFAGKKLRLQVGYESFHAPETAKYKTRSFNLVVELPDFAIAFVAEVHIDYWLR
jgi:hypothetical protein